MTHFTTESSSKWAPDWHDSLCFLPWWMIENTVLPWWRWVLQASHLFVHVDSMYSLPLSKVGFNLQVGKIPWRREQLPTPVFWPGEFCDLYGVVAPWMAKSRTRLNDFHFLPKVMSTEKENQRKSGLASDTGHPSGAVATEQWSLLTAVTSTPALQCIATQVSSEYPCFRVFSFCPWDYIGKHHDQSKEVYSEFQNLMFQTVTYI